MGEPTDTLRASDLPIALYLNQRVTFDLLASLEDGFAHVTTVQESSSDAKKSTLEGGAALGIGNPFTFLGLTLGAKGRRGTASGSSGTTTEELVHTPTSLFARLRAELFERKLVKTIKREDTDFGAIAAGQFVEFQAVLRRSPLIVVLDTYLTIAPMMDLFSDQDNAPAPTKGRRQRAKGKQPNETAQAMKQVTFIRDAVTADGSEDFFAECGKSRFVLTAEAAYFVDPTMNDVIDGTFRVFGKVTRSVPAEEQDGISLLRRSALGNFASMVENLEAAFASLPDAGFTGQSVQTEIPGPTLQVIPIAIFA